MTPQCPLCAAASCTKLCEGRVSSISTLHVGPGQPDPTSNPSPNPKPSGGSRSTGAVTRPRRVFRWRFSEKKPGGRKTRILHRSLAQGASAHSSRHSSHRVDHRTPCGLCAYSRQNDHPPPMVPLYKPLWAQEKSPIGFISESIQEILTLISIATYRGLDFRPPER